jgi:hypothetical protein
VHNNGRRSQHPAGLDRYSNQQWSGFKKFFFLGARFSTFSAQKILDERAGEPNLWFLLTDLLSIASIRKKLHASGKYSVLTTLRRKVTLSPVEKSCAVGRFARIFRSIAEENMAD